MPRYSRGRPRTHTGYCHTGSARPTSVLAGGRGITGGRQLDDAEEALLKIEDQLNDLGLLG